MSFDPYQEWLRIPPAEQPPNYYRLLGVADFETDTNRIHTKTLDRLQKLRTYQAGTHSEHSQRLMNEISKASVCLLDSESKKAYDESLRLIQAPAIQPPHHEIRTARRAGLLCGLAVALAGIVAVFLIKDRDTLLQSTRELNTANSGNSSSIVADQKPPQKSEAIVGEQAPSKAAEKIDPKKLEFARRIQSLPNEIQKRGLGLLTKLGEAELARRQEKDRQRKQQVVADINRQRPRTSSDAFTIVQKSAQSPSRMILQSDLPMPLSFVNTEADEFDPFLDADGLTLYFCRRESDREEVLFARRENKDQGFSLVGRMKGLPETAKLRSPAVVDEGRSLLFSSNSGDGFRLYQADRDSAFGPAKNIRTMAAGNSVVDTQMLDPFAAKDGLEIFFTSLEGNVRRLMTQRRVDSKEKFGEPQRVPLPSSFHHATLTADGLTMYVAGSTSKGRWGIYRSHRTSSSGNWSMPLPVPHLSSPAGTIGDVSPFISPAGDMLFFATDRESENKKLDIWVMKISPVPPAEVQAQSAAVHDPIDEWLVLGPLPHDQPTSDIDSKFIKRLVPSIRKKPIREGEKFENLVWRRAGTLGVERGLYFVALPFESPGPGELRLEIARAPGGVNFWLNSGQNSRDVLATDSNTLWEAHRPKEATRSNKIKIFKGNYTLLGAVCGSTLDELLNVRLLDYKTLDPPKQLTVRFTSK